MKISEQADHIKGIVSVVSRTCFCKKKSYLNTKLCKKDETKSAYKKSSSTCIKCRD